MTKRELLDTLQHELMQHPSQELLDCQRAVTRITAKTFQQFWKALDPEEAVTWQDLALRLEKLSSQN